jgi:hypothetical protein
MAVTIASNGAPAVLPGSAPVPALPGPRPAATGGILAKLRHALGHQDILFAVGIIMLVAVLVLPMPTWVVDIGLATSITLSVLILMVAIWIDKPLDFSSFPTVLLVVTLLRLALDLATTRLILANGHHGLDAAGSVINGFASFIVGGDFVIGVVVFAILDQLHGHHQGCRPHRRSRRPFLPGCHAGQADGDRRRPVRRHDQ